MIYWKKRKSEAAMRFDTVLIDVDDTLFDFRKSSFEALVKAFAEIGVTFTEEDMLRYEVFNDQMWKSYELGEIEKDFIYAERFRRYFASIGLDADPVAINRRYLLELAEGRNFIPHCKELLQALHGKYLVVVVTNGDTYAQERRIEHAPGNDECRQHTERKNRPIPVFRHPTGKSYRSDRPSHRCRKRYRHP